MEADVQCSDQCLEAQKTRNYNFDMQMVALNSENIKPFNTVELSTGHDIFDYKMVENEAKLILNTRGRLNKSDKM